MASRKDIDFVDTFEYLGFHFKSGGDRWHHVEIRMAMVASAFGWLGHIWRGSWLSQWLKLWIYNTYIVFVLTWGLPAWWLGDVERRKLRGWNARLLTWLLGTEHENFGEVVWQQTREPLFDLVAKLWVWWLRWLGHTLWDEPLHSTSTIRRHSSLPSRFFLGRLGPRAPPRALSDQQWWVPSSWPLAAQQLLTLLRCADVQS